jgi:SanA protein
MARQRIYWLMKNKNNFKKIRILLLITITIIIVGAISIDRFVAYVGDRYIIPFEEIPKVDAILVPGAHVYSDGSVSHILNDRLITAFESYKTGKSIRILVSGDHGQKNYDEANTMKNFLIQKGIKPEIIFMDHAGFSTYDTLYRTRDVFKVKKVLICTQKYHLSRALYTARSLGLEAYGVPSDKRHYVSIQWYQLREIPARLKAFFYVKIFKPRPKFLGKEIPISGNGEATND